MELAKIMFLFFVRAIFSPAVSAAPTSDTEANNTPTCKYDAFYDSGTGRCELCWEICDKAAYMGTEKECNENCPGYLIAKGCEKEGDKFFDVTVNSCSPCSLLCNNHEHMGTTKDCAAKCKDYMEKRSPEEFRSNLKTNSLVAAQAVQENPENTAEGFHPAWIAAIVFGGITTACIVVAVVAMRKFRSAPAQYLPAPTNEAPKRPVEETSQHDGSPTMALPISSRTEAFAMSDLADVRRPHSQLISSSC